MNIGQKYLSDEIVTDEADISDENKELWNSNKIFCVNPSNELFDEEEAAKKHRIISVKRISLPRNGERWEIIDDGKKSLVLKGTRLTNREKTVLRTPDGIKLVINEYKAGNKSVAKIKNKLREYWIKNND